MRTDKKKGFASVPGTLAVLEYFTPAGKLVRGPPPPTRDAPLIKPPLKKVQNRLIMVKKNPTLNKFKKPAGKEVRVKEACCQ